MRCSLLPHLSLDFAVLVAAGLLAGVCITLPAVAIWPYVAAVFDSLGGNPLTTLYVLACALAAATAAYSLVLAVSLRNDRRAAVGLAGLVAVSLAFSGLSAVYALTATMGREPTLLAPYFNDEEPRGLTLLICFNIGTSVAFLLLANSILSMRMRAKRAWIVYAWLTALPNLAWYYARTGTLGQFSWVLCASALLPPIVVYLLLRRMAASAISAASLDDTASFTAADVQTVTKLVLATTVGQAAFTVSSVIYLAGASGPVYSEALFCAVILLR